MEPDCSAKRRAVRVAAASKAVHDADLQALSLSNTLCSCVFVSWPTKEAGSCGPGRADFGARLDDNNGAVRLEPPMEADEKDEFDSLVRLVDLAEGVAREEGESNINVEDSASEDD